MQLLEVLETHKSGINKLIVAQRQDFESLLIQKCVRFHRFDLVEGRVEDLQVQEELHVVFLQRLDLVIAEIDDFDRLLAEPARL